MTLAKAQTSFPQNDWAKAPGAKWPLKKQLWNAWGMADLEQLPARQAQERPTPQAKAVSFEAQTRQKPADKECELHAAHENTAASLAAKLPTLSRATNAHAYLRRKGISAHEGLKKNCYGNLVIPAQDIHGKVWAAQKIYTDGNKCYQADNLKTGCFHVLGAAPGQGVAVLAKAAVIILAQGYATAATITETTSYPTVAAFDSNNLVPVARALRGRFPDKPILICGNDDRHLKHRARPDAKFHAGHRNATQAAEAVAGVAVFPPFTQTETAERPKEFISFNDLAQKSARGRAAVETTIRAGISRATEAIQ